MAIAEVQSIPITRVDDAVERVWEYILEHKCQVLEAVAAIWPECRFDNETLHLLAMDGLLERAQHDKRLAMRSPTAKPGLGWGAPHGRRWHDYLNSLTHPYQGADGAKALYEFTRDDLAVFATNFRKMADGYLRRATWADDALAILDEHGKDQIKDLPSQALKQVADAASEAFGKQE